MSMCSRRVAVPGRRRRFRWRRRCRGAGRRSCCATARSSPANMMDIRMEPSSDFQECSRVSLPVRRHRVRWKSRSDSIRSSRPCRRRRSIASMAARSEAMTAVAVRQFAQVAGGQGFERGAHGEDVADFLGVQVAHGEPAARPGGDQAFLLELAHRLAEGAAADLQHLGQFGFHQWLPRRQFAAGDGACAARSAPARAGWSFPVRSSELGCCGHGASPVSAVDCLQSSVDSRSYGRRRRARRAP